MLADMGMPLTDVIEIECPDKICEERVLKRLIHKPSGRSYSRHYPKLFPLYKGKYWKKLVDNGTIESAAPPLDDKTGEPLIIRSDDNADALEERLSKYHKVEGILRERYYAFLLTLEGVQDAED